RTRGFSFRSRSSVMASVWSSMPFRVRETVKTEPNPFPLSAMVVLFIGSKCLVLEAGVSNARRSTRGEQRLQLAEGPSAGRRGAWRGVSAGPDEKLRREDRHRRHHFARGIPFQDVAVCAALRSDVRISTAVQIPQIIRPIA